MNLNHLIQILGVDRAILASVTTQLLRFVTGPITLLLIIRYLTPETQGFFYTFASVAGLQVFLEAGFAMCIAQFSSKEFSALRFNKRKLLTGDKRNLSRVRSIVFKAGKYYAIMAIFLTVALLVGGYAFFSAQPSGNVPWLAPWVIVSLCAGATFLITPFFAVLEGCNRVADMAIFRLWSTLVGFGATVSAIVVTQSIWVAAWASLAALIFAIGYIYIVWRRFLFQVLRKYDARYQVNWRGQIWSFQWRIASTWGARYIMEGGIPAIVFALFGPVLAGQAGMLAQLCRLMANVGSSWTVTKVPFWGNLAAQGRFAEMDQLWQRSAFRHVLVAVFGQALLMLGVGLLPYTFPHFADRLLSFWAALGLSAGWMFYAAWLVCSHYCRSHRIEPYTWLHWLVVAVFIAMILVTQKAWGIYAVTNWFAFVHLPAALVSLVILARLRSLYLGATKPDVP
jgi:hypothetical protein